MGSLAILERGAELRTVENSKLKQKMGLTQGATLVPKLDMKKFQNSVIDRSDPKELSEYQRESMSGQEKEASSRFKSLVHDSERSLRTHDRAMAMQQVSFERRLHQKRQGIREDRLS